MNRERAAFFAIEKLEPSPVEAPRGIGHSRPDYSKCGINVERYPAING